MSSDHLNEFRITVVIVTYAERRFFIDVASSLAKQNWICDFVIVSNGSGANLDFEPFGKPHHLVVIEQNSGAAAGFAAGIKFALTLENEFIWLLDDDNLPEPDALCVLLNFWNDKKLSLVANKTSLMSFRTSQFAYKSITYKKELNLLPTPNSFLGFHYKRLPKMIVDRINTRRRRYSRKIVEAESIVCNAGFYGGLFFSKKLMGTINLPDGDYFLYVDDLVFTSQIPRSGGKIYMLPKSIINDLDYSLPLTSKKKFLYHPALDFESNFKAFYYARNVSYFTRKYAISNRIVYLFNKSLLRMILGVIARLRNKRGRLKVMLSGIRAGERWYQSSS
ncbi:MAG: glycosyltransferase [Cyclobacteriaceae bacterium]